MADLILSVLIILVSCRLSTLDFSKHGSDLLSASGCSRKSNYDLHHLPNNNSRHKPPIPKAPLTNAWIPNDQP